LLHFCLDENAVNVDEIWQKNKKIMMVNFFLPSANWFVDLDVP
jgi:hypothetical protein